MFALKNLNPTDIIYCGTFYYICTSNVGVKICENKYNLRAGRLRSNIMCNDNNREFPFRGFIDQYP